MKLFDGPATPSELELEEWIFKKGLQNHDDLAVFLYSLTMGRDEINRVRRWNEHRMTANSLTGYLGVSGSPEERLESLRTQRDAIDLAPARVPDLS